VKEVLTMERDYIKRDYSVKDDSHVFLTVLIGNAQIGGTAVMVDGNNVVTGEIKDLYIGNGSELKNKGARITTTVSDINENTNILVVRYIVSGGIKKMDEERTLTVENDGDAGRFTLALRFLLG
jgi:hypothetical protein